MNFFFLNEQLYFPPVEKADEHGILAIGGDLSIERLKLAYSSGIFPWFSENEPIVWWSPDPRFVLDPENLKVSKSMRPIFNQKKFRVSLDQDFRTVIEACGEMKRVGQSGTWITQDMIEAYCDLHQEGLAHSVEVWQDDEIVGGLYGVSLGKCFFGESMFSKVNNASKTGFIALVQKLASIDFKLIDCQVYTKHLASLGAEYVAREHFITKLRTYIKEENLKGNWGKIFGDLL